MRRKDMTGMKRFTVFALLLSFSASLAGCGVKKEERAEVSVNANDEILSYYSDYMTVDEVMNDIKGIDMYHNMDVEGLTSEEEMDEESSTKLIKYYDKDNNHIYTAYEGYGEECFDYFTDTKSGKKACVKYIETEGNPYEVSITTDEYTVDMCELDKAADFGAKSILVSVYKEESNGIQPSVQYQLTDDTWVVGSASYFAEDGYHVYYSYVEDGKLVEDDSILYVSSDKKEVDNIYNMASDESVKNIDFLAGEHSLSYVDVDGQRSWIITGSFVAEFDGVEKAKEFSGKYGYEAVSSETNEEIYVAELGQYSIAVSGDCSGFAEFVQNEFNDYFYIAVEINEMGEIIDLYHDGVGISYY